MNKKIALYINGQYICTSTRYKRCKDFKNKVLSDGFIKWRGLSMLRDECYILKASDKVQCKFIKGV